ncbi:MAG: prevent-host-death protein [Verrucomicrobia bacterium]|nr:prevent-host-death protein [Verrucomicrobiota bacterium]
MHTVSLFEAKTHLSRIVEEILSGKENHVVISRRGKPVVQLTAVRKTDSSKRIGLAHGRFKVPDNIDGANKVIASLFHGRRQS